MALLAWSVTSPASAEDAPRALVICAQCVTDADSAIEDGVREALRKTERFEVLPAPALDLEAVQLSIDCPEQDARCLREVAKRLQTAVLLVTQITRSGEGAKLRVLYFDARSDVEPRSVSRAQASGAGRDAWSGELPALLRELLPKAEPEPKAAVEPEAEPEQTEGDSAVDAAPTEPAPSAASGAASPLPLGPMLLGGGGLAAVAAGLITGAIMRGTESDYAAREIDSQEQAELAEAERSRGRTQAVVANVLLGTGLAAVAAAGVWLVLDLRSPERPEHATLSPVVGPHGAGLVVSSRWEAP